MDHVTFNAKMCTSLKFIKKTEKASDVDISAFEGKKCEPEGRSQLEHLINC